MQKEGRSMKAIHLGSTCRYGSITYVDVFAPTKVTGLESYNKLFCSSDNTILWGQECFGKRLRDAIYSINENPVFAGTKYILLKITGNILEVTWWKMLCENKVSYSVTIEMGTLRPRVIDANFRDEYWMSVLRKDLVYLYTSLKRKFQKYANFSKMLLICEPAPYGNKYNPAGCSTLVVGYSTTGNNFVPIIYSSLRSKDYEKRFYTPNTYEKLEKEKERKHF